MTTTRAGIARSASAVVALMVVSLLIITGSRAAFIGQTTNPGNSVAVTNGVFTDNDGNIPMFSVTNLVPGDIVSSCITLYYNGPSTFTPDLGANLVDNTDDLAKDVLVTVTETTGSASDTFGDCTGFVGGTPVFTGALDTLTPAATTTHLPMTAGTYRRVKFDITVPIVADPFGKSVTADFVWDGTSV